MGGILRELARHMGTRREGTPQSDGRVVLTCYMFDCPSQLLALEGGDVADASAYVPLQQRIEKLKAWMAAQPKA